MGRKSFKEKAKNKYKHFEDKAKEEASRAANDFKQMWRDDNERAKKCLDIVNKQGVEMCSKDTKEPLKEVTTQRLDYNHPNAGDCLKEFTKEGFIPCSDIPSTALLCLERLKSAGNELCNKTEGRPLVENNISSIDFSFNEHSADFSLKCYTTITGFSKDIANCAIAEGDL